MAFDVKQINPLDLRPSVGVGVGLPFSSTSVFNTTYTTQEAIKANLINYLLTGRGERFLNPTLGTGLRELLFSQATEDTRTQVDSVVRSGIANWFPNITINTLGIELNPDANTCTIYLNYSVIMTNITDQVVINFEQ